MTTLTREEEKNTNIARPNFQHEEKFTDLSSRQLKKLDMTLVLTAYGSQSTVNLSNNLLTILPSSFSQCLSHIQVLDLSRNRLQKLPDNFDQMENLHTLILYQNKLHTLPLCFGNLNNLRWLDISANPLDPLLRQVCGEHLAHGAVVAKNVREFFYLLLKATELYEESETDLYKPPIVLQLKASRLAQLTEKTVKTTRRKSKDDLKTTAQSKLDDVYHVATAMYQKKLNRVSASIREHQVKESRRQFLIHFGRFLTIYLMIVFLLLAIASGPPKSLLTGGSGMKQYTWIPSILINAISWFLFCTAYQLRDLIPWMGNVARVFVVTPNSWFSGWLFS